MDHILDKQNREKNGMTSPRQNRVDPWGTIVAVSSRGTLLGNRGILHDENKRIVKTHQHQSWVTCKLDYKNRKRKIMSPGTYTELFFLDEATAFAAGHRPCCECRRERYHEFKDFWVKANLAERKEFVTVSEINKVMHAERIKKREKVSFKAAVSKLPDGTLFSHENAAYLVFETGIYLWSFAGYHRLSSVNLPAKVDVLTPQSVVNAFRLGFKPDVHESVKAGIVK